ncbi:Lateral organ boundaries, LOB [Dillenia turbinata]|uniref:Lateral organ boundaries, LOB n=1 Tax=Dillenia turbinata TaxID=194707 RepID=A0AAN8VN53_9MAGN
MDQNLQELPEHQRNDAVSSMVYEANARVRDPVYGCVGAISSLQQQINVLQTQLAVAQAEVLHMRMNQFSSSPSSNTLPPHSTEEYASTPSKLTSSRTKSLFSMDMVVDHHQPNFGEFLWSC